MDEPRGRPKLRLLKGGLELAEARRQLIDRVEFADDGRPPFMPEAIVIEQDRDLVLAPPKPEFEEPGESVNRLMLRVMNQPRRDPGGVIIAGGVPLTLFAVVHDMECDPSWREPWIATALGDLFAIATRHRLAKMAMPLLGTVHGRLDPARAVALLLSALESAGEFPQRLWLRSERLPVEKLQTLVRGGL